MGYETPGTLGVDRLANAIACHQLSEGSALAIDLGTCIKYDFVDSEGTYQGGAISPGIELRYQAMHQFTGKLPLVIDRQIPSYIGKNTMDAMRSGVMNGILEEIKGFIERYRAEYPDLTIFLTGGDHQYFDIGLKNGIFADENLTLKGLQIVLVHALA
jgi:type III pantothenate kinase